MQLFSREKRKARPIEQEAEYQPLDPVALCLALWLGMMVCGSGLIRLSDDAARRAENPDRSALSTPAAYPAGFGS